jgi:hypothetical protein
MLEIVSRHTTLDLDNPLLTEAVSQFWQVRRQMVADNKPGKKVSTSELIDLVKLLKHRYHDQLAKPGGIRAEDIAEDLIVPSILLKSLEDQKQYPKQT